MKLAFKMFPKEFNWIEVRELGWLEYNLNTIVLRPFFGLFGSVF